MADGPTTELFGIPVPSTDPLFLTFVGIHVVLGIGATTMGAAAMFMRKGRGLHSRFGTLYFWTLTAVCITMAVLSAMRWRENYHQELPPIAFWIVPGAIGVPLIVRAMLRHPLIRAVPSRRAIHGPRTSM
jgi:hypothetical protein